MGTRSALGGRCTATLCDMFAGQDVKFGKDNLIHKVVQNPEMRMVKHGVLCATAINRLKFWITNATRLGTAMACPCQLHERVRLHIR
jgi:hypothetical protein